MQLFLKYYRAAHINLAAYNNYGMVFIDSEIEN